MANFLEIQEQLAVMVGAQSVDELPPGEQSQIKMIINQMYRWCYLPPDGSRPRWSAREVHLTFPAPMSIIMERTAGSTVFSTMSNNSVVPSALPEANIGGVIELPGGKHTRLDSVTLTGGTTLAKAGVTEIVSATFYSSVCALPADTADVEKHPLCDDRILLPMDDREQERVFHTITEDFGLHKVRAGAVSKGQPYHYYIDETIINNEILPRFAVYPLPDKAYEVLVRANVTPATLVGDTERPLLPLDVVEDCLVPMARAKFAEVTPRYNSKNLQHLIADRKDAEKRLKSFAQKQKGRNRRMLMRVGY
jgi:hypothetical protein